MNKLQQIKRILNALAEYFQTTLTPTQLAMYAEDLEDLALEDIGAAIKRIRQNPQIARFPLPAAIRQEIVGSARDEALEAASRIVQAMEKYGYTNPEKARAFIGELGWRVVEREGGWQSLCQRTSSDDLPILKAQWRELAAASIRRVGIGLDNQAPRLTRGDRKPELTSIAAMLPTIAKGKDSA